MILLLKLIRESYLFAINAIIVNKVRTLLSLSGITIGIFSLIAVFSVFDSLERSIRNSLDDFGSNVLFIQKWPWMMGGGDYPWWRYVNRPEATLAELDEIQRRSNTAEAAALTFGAQRNMSFGGNTYENVSVNAVSHDYPQVMSLNIREGRYFTRTESLGGRNVVIIGSQIAEELFPNIDPLGQSVKLAGNKATVVGILETQGSGAFGNTTDDHAYVPVNFARNFVNIRNTGTTIVVKARSNVSNEQLMDEMTGIMRSLRKLKPGEENNFALNEISVINQGLQSFFSGLGLIGGIIGGFSLLVGGFGIANIMFVSVRERTNIIGIQKAIGAKKYFILLQFLFEAIFLALLGGILGLVIVYLGMLIFQDSLGFALILSQKNVILGVLISSIIGLLSGLIPAWSASQLDPVEAIRFGY
jgi:putative ABC transport system permease protein